MLVSVVLLLMLVSVLSYSIYRSSNNQKFYYARFHYNVDCDDDYCPSFTKAGTFEIITCPATNPCPPDYYLRDGYGNLYELFFTGKLTIPINLQTISIAGTIMHDLSMPTSCAFDGQLIPCQPLGLVLVSSWSYGWN